MSTVYVIFMLLLIVLPPVFKAIEKSLSNAGQDSRARQIKRMREVLFDEEKEDKDYAPDNEFCPPVSPQYEGEMFPVPEYISTEAEVGEKAWTVTEATSIPQELLEGGYMSVRDIVEKRSAAGNMQKAVVAEQEKVRKIDPKKLVLYSEIMKTKF